MSVDTKGVVLTHYKDVLVITALVERAVSKVVNEERELMFPAVRRWDEKVQEQFRTPDVTLRPESGMVDFGFRFRGENRSLKLFLTCDCDHLELAPKSVSLSIGCWGSSDIIMQSALHALSLLGPAYYDYNDCDSLDLAPLQEVRPTLLEAVRLDYVNDIFLDDWLERFEELKLKTAAQRKAFLGCPETTFRKACEIEVWEERKKAVEALVAKTPVPRVRFLEEYHELMACREAAGEATPAAAA